ncbi:cytochrome c biogenesis protein CcsA [Paenibacillus sp. DMB20]|uniref:cytochrome c biogenesis protein CcsA n=1 Tax=Paenibacillus sp. DMB20 TaxID=1642570 RepID=UPI000627D8A1|nr:cytochrome c biogenesis protein CcsA [Paenibacillus sp. DMB20]KKO51326.1 ABC transporter permease [Paenibacillus sp. DMB20]KKO51840.1 ABC transporter permease [Paenibacillus sp. DMB20]
MSLNLIYDIGICIYALSLLFYISDCVSRNRAAKRIGTGLLVVAALFQLVAVLQRVIETGMLPVFTSFDFLLLCSFGVTLTSIAITFVKRAEFAALLLSVVGFCVTVLNRLLLTTGYNPLEAWDPVKGLLVFHIALASVSLTALTVGAVFAGMYLFLHSKLKHKKWNDVIRRLPSLEILDKYSYNALLIGTPVLVLSLGLAIFSVATEGRWTLLADLKVLSTSVALGIYVNYFVRRRIQRRSGLETARWALIGLAFIVLNFFLNAWSEFHSWSGV